VKDLLPGRRIAHIATHGFFLEGTRAGRVPASRDASPAERGIGGIGALRPEPTSSQEDAPPTSPFRLAGLALAGANLRDRAGPDEDDGILIAEEIASLDLSSLDWVVLSACQTGVGEVMTGEGVFGLRRAFEIAGAGTLVMSLWGVEDSSTREWMNLLYEGRLTRMLETAEAVREADLGMLRSRRAQGRSTHPFYWAAFIATGDWR
jgi:CHAT domain-containing protein